MKPSVTLRGAQRFPMNSKQGNKDYYKGTRQSYAPGAGVRTGAPGVHDKRGGYRLLDDKVRVFVAPPRAVLDSTNLRPYVDQSYRTPPSHAMPDPYSGFEIFQKHAQLISTEGPDLRSRWQRIIDARAAEGEAIPRLEGEDEEVLMIGPGEETGIDYIPPVHQPTTPAQPEASSSASSPSPTPSPSIDPEYMDEQDDFEDPDRLPPDEQVQPSDLNAPRPTTPILEMTLAQLDAMQRSAPPSDTWTPTLEDRYQSLKWEYLLKPPSGTINPLYWDHWKLLSEEQKEAYKFIAKRLWWDVCAQRIREATG